jgi:hypothetical protein
VISTHEKSSVKLEKELKDKLDVLLELLESAPDGKFLLFANFPQTFEKIKTELKTKNITCKILKGTTCQVQKTLDDFKDGKIRVIMLNAKFFGAGMNLQIATHVVLYHRFESDLEEQVIGRAQRLGRTDPLNVIYLIHDNESGSFDNTTTKFEEVDYNTWLEQDELVEHIEEPNTQVEPDLQIKEHTLQVEEKISAIKQIDIENDQDLSLAEPDEAISIESERKQSSRKNKRRVRRSRKRSTRPHKNVDIVA